MDVNAYVCCVCTAEVGRLHVCTAEVGRFHADQWVDEDVAHRISNGRLTHHTFNGIGVFRAVLEIVLPRERYSQGYATVNLGGWTWGG